MIRNEEFTIPKGASLIGSFKAVPKGHGFINLIIEGPTVLIMPDGEKKHLVIGQELTGLHSDDIEVEK